MNSANNRNEFGRRPRAPDANVDSQHLDFSLNKEINHAVPYL